MEISQKSSMSHFDMWWMNEPFSHSENLKNHKCNSCDKAFCFSWKLKTHIQKVHEGRKTTNVKNVENYFLIQDLKNHKCNSCLFFLEVEISLGHSKDDTVFHTATILKIFSIHNFSFTAAWAGHWLLGRLKQL